MKKVISVLVLGLLIAFPLLADGSWTNNGNPIDDNSGKDQQASITASFEIKSENIKDNVEIGFTSKDLSTGESFSVTTEVTPISDEVTLKDTNGDRIATNAEGGITIINAYGQITSFNSLNVYLGISAPLTGETNNQNKLGWKIKSGEDVLLDISDTTSTMTKTASPILSHSTNGTGTTIYKAGYKPISIETYDYAGKAVDTYKGVLYIMIESVGSN